MNEEEIQTQRKSWELEDHWQLRSNFMTIYCDAFPKDKLLCLAQAFVNVETLGVRYGPDLMEEIEQFAENVPGLSKYRAIKERRDVEGAERSKEYKIINHESSPSKESASHMISNASIPSSLPESGCMTGNDLVEMCKNMELKQTENPKSAKAKLDEWCLAKFGSKPVYDISRVGPGHIILPFVKVILPNKDEFGFPSNSFESTDKMFEVCASLALRSLKIDDSSIDLSLIAPPVLPPPPLKWFEQDKSRSIPESFVAENHQILDRLKEKQKTKQSTSISPPNQQYQHQYQNPHQNSYQHHQQQNQHYQAQIHSNLNSRNGQHRNNQQFEGPIMTNGPVAMSRPFSMQPFSSKPHPHPQRPETSYGEQQQQQQIYRPFPRLMTGPRPNKFIPLQVARNKQTPRELAHNAERIQDAKRALVQDNKAEHTKNEMVDHSPRLSEHTESSKKSISRRQSRVMVRIASKPEPAE